MSRDKRRMLRYQTSMARGALGLAALLTLLFACAEEPEPVVPPGPLETPKLDAGRLDATTNDASDAGGTDDASEADASDAAADDDASDGDASDPGPLVTITTASPPPLTTTEYGGTATFTVALRARPTSNVVIPLASTRPTEGTTSVTSLTFTPDDYDVPQTVTVTGQPDGVVDGDQDYEIELGPVTSDDPAYAGLTVPSVPMRNLDVDGTKILVTPGPSNQTTEAGGTATFTVRLTAEPTAPVTIGISSSVPSEGTPSVTSLTFDAADWNVEKTVTVTGQDDDVDDDDQTYAIVFAPAESDDLRYAGVKPDDLTFVNVDDDEAGFETTGPTPSARTSENGDSVSLSFRLATRPTADVTFPLSISNPAEASVSTSSITFTPDDWSTPKTVTVTGKDDGVIDPDVQYSLVIGPATSADAKYDGMDPPDITLINVSKCGDGVVEPHEQCDDGNAAKCDGCESCELRRAVRLTHADAGGASYIEGPVATEALRGSMCVELWARLDGDSELVVAASSSEDVMFRFSCYAYGVLQFWSQSDMYDGWGVIAEENCADGTFHHFAACREVDGTTVTHRVFVDGEFITEYSMDDAGVGSAGAKIFVGGPEFDPRGVSGIVDELRISIGNRYTSSFVPPRRLTSDANTYLLWHMDEPDSTTTIVDASGNNRNGTLKGTNPQRVADTGYRAAMCQ